MNKKGSWEKGLGWDFDESVDMDLEERVLKLFLQVVFFAELLFPGAKSTFTLFMKNFVGDFVVCWHRVDFILMLKNM